MRIVNPEISGLGFPALAGFGSGTAVKPVLHAACPKATGVLDKFHSVNISPA
jgi:hypothetical protein